MQQHIIRVILVRLTCCALLYLHSCGATEYDHKYAVGEAVTLWVNTVGPHNNPQETYNYYSLPFCRPHGLPHPAHKWGGLGEVLEGNELIDSQIDIKFRMTIETSVICKMDLNGEKALLFQQAIENTYWFEFFMGMSLGALYQGFQWIL